MDRMEGCWPASRSSASMCTACTSTHHRPAI